MKIYLTCTAFIFLLILTQRLVGQERIEETNSGLADALNEIKIELKGTEIGQKLEVWHNSLKTNNIKIKMLFDEEGFISILKMINLSNRLTRDNLPLETSDVTDIKSFIAITERLGCEMPTGLKDELLIIFTKSIGKTKPEILHVFKGSK